MLVGTVCAAPLDVTATTDESGRPNGAIVAVDALSGWGKIKAHFSRNWWKYGLTLAGLGGTDLVCRNNNWAWHHDDRDNDCPDKASASQHSQTIVRDESVTVIVSNSDNVWVSIDYKPLEGSK